jgi:hypothetical protein
MDATQTCFDCKCEAPETNSDYTLISSGVATGKRLARRHAFVRVAVSRVLGEAQGAHRALVERVHTGHAPAAGPSSFLGAALQVDDTRFRSALPARHLAGLEERAEVVALSS